MEDVEFEFIATPLIGHLVALVELAKNLVAHHPHLSVAIHILNAPTITDSNLDSYLQSAVPSAGNDRISLTELPPLDNPLKTEEWSSKRPFFIFNLFANLYKPVFKHVVQNRRLRVIGILSDMLIPHFSDVAEELGIPSYILFTSGANLLAMMFKLESIGVDLPSAFGDLPPESAPIEVSGFRNPIQLSVWPEIFLNKQFSAQFLSYASSEDRNPPVYTVGPVLDLSCLTARDLHDREINVRDHPIIDWLDTQPPASVVFLCFGSVGSFRKEQVEQIAIGIEQSGHRFLWSLRRQPNSDKGERLPSDFNDFNEVLPAGFLDRTKGIGKMIGWAPQTEVLSHPAVGAFVSHCRWNSVLESLWFGVPVVTWPMYAEQQLNAFCMVRELGIAVELRIDYKYDVMEKKGNMVVTSEEVEKGIRKMMEEDDGVMARIKVKKISEIAKQTLNVGGSSHKSLHVFTRDLIESSSMK